MRTNLVAESAITIDAPIAKVWAALVTPDAIKQFMFGANVASDWKEGSAIVWKGEWQGKAYQDKGVILRIEPERVLQYTHWSPMSGIPDRSENYHVVTIEISDEGASTSVHLSQDNNATEEARDHSEQNWSTMLGGLKKYLEGEEPSPAA